MKIPRYGKLSARLRELGLSQTDLAYALRLSPGAISQRMQGNTAWNIEEMYRTMELCRISPEEMHIYFPDPTTTKKRGSTVAVDPSVIPLGAELLVDYGDGAGLRRYRAEDTGGAVKGNHKELQEAYGCQEPYDIVLRVLDDNVGALAELANAVLDFYGMGDSIRDQLKN